ncbi:hypothetical protein WJX73_001887 [Symbiochloris irregularis]|uniref:Replication termination factor 2 n=1 Tax=Symbiochloris irregularis TaxID=706552 RepID=A0AAW1NWK2_9CHLO
MGLDGGTYITRSDVLRGQSWALAQQDTSRSTRGGSVSTSGAQQGRQPEQDSVRAARWSTCTLTGEPLREPVAADFLGSLYNKEALLEFLLVRAGVVVSEEAQHRYANQLRQSGVALDHLQSTRDMFAVQLPGPSTSAVVQEGGGSGKLPCYECPINYVRCDRQPFSAIVGCGHVLSNRAIQQATDEQCPVCGASFDRELDIIAINGSAEAVERLTELLPARRKRKQRHSAGSKKRQRSGAERSALHVPSQPDLQPVVAA